MLLYTIRSIYLKAKANFYIDPRYTPLTYNHDCPYFDIGENQYI